MSVIAPNLHFRFADGQTATDRIGGVTLTNGTPTISARGLECDGDDFLASSATWYNAAAGTFYMRAIVDAVTANSVLFEIIGGSTDRIRLASAITTNDVSFVGVNNTNQFVITQSTVATGVEFVFAGAWATNDAVSYINGTQVGTDASVTPPDELSPVLHIGNWGDAASRPLTGAIAELAYWNTRLDNTTLDGLSDGTLVIFQQPSGAAGMGLMSKFGFLGIS